MAEQKMKMTDEQLSQELHKSKGGRTGGKLLSLFGGIVIVSGIILGGNMVLIIAGAVLLGLGQMTHEGSEIRRASRPLTPSRLTS